MKLFSPDSSDSNRLQIATHRLELRPLTLDDAEELLLLKLRNREAFKPFDPPYPDGHFTLRAQQDIIREFERTQRLGTSYGFGIFLKKDHELLGRVAIRNVERGAAMSGTLGFFLDAGHQSQGYMTEACKAIVNYAIKQIALHRVEAAVMPHNTASRRVFEKLGFRVEGLARSYLYIDGAWRDHLIYAVTKEDWITNSQPKMSRETA